MKNFFFNTIVSVISLTLFCTVMHAQIQLNTLPAGNNLPLPGFPGVTYSITYPSGFTTGPFGAYVTDDNVYSWGPTTNQTFFAPSTSHPSAPGWAEITFSQPIPVKYVVILPIDLDYLGNTITLSLSGGGTATLMDFNNIHGYGDTNMITYDTSTGSIGVNATDTNSNTLAASAVITGSGNNTVKSIRQTGGISGQTEGLRYAFAIFPPDQIDPCDLAGGSIDPCDCGVSCCNDGSIILRNSEAKGCPENITVDFKIYNGDDDVMPAGTPISFYDGDPTQSGATLLYTYSLGMDIQNGATENFTDIQLMNVCSLTNGELIYAVLADDGTNSLPLDLSTQESDGYDDCTMEDNMTSIKLKDICARYESMIKKE